MNSLYSSIKASFAPSPQLFNPALTDKMQNDENNLVLYFPSNCNHESLSYCLPSLTHYSLHLILLKPLHHPSYHSNCFVQSHQVLRRFIGLLHLHLLVDFHYLEDFRYCSVLVVLLDLILRSLHLCYFPVPCLWHPLMILTHFHFLPLISK